ncbi:MAG: glutathione synthase [Xanthomonadales bacterium]|nr:Glutathione synthetase [Xanthomonadales bacterium]MCC6593589.1 glutathione synthase [Xanthomonadales bacterium]MCE7931755.1 glutathione synthase [Xanthomonadales bacterium PRO6]
MPRRLAVLMDPIQKLKIHKDTTFAMLLEAQRRGHELHVLEQRDLGLRDGRAWLRTRKTRVKDDPAGWFEQDTANLRDATEFDWILLRKDPPFDAEYLYDTQILERAEACGASVVNRPAALRDANEKLFTALFPQCCPPTLVSRLPADLRAFIDEHGECVAKVLDSMGGTSIFRVAAGDPNLNVIFETVTGEGSRAALVQRYIPQISEGDKRILMIDGEPVPYALARIPQAGEFRGNLAKGGRGRGQPLSERDRWICAQVGPELRRRGLLFVGLDVIGDYLTEVNVTSPTCVRELDAAFGLNIAGDLFDRLEALRP